MTEHEVMIDKPSIPVKRLIILAQDSLCYEYQGCKNCPISGYGECPFNRIIDDLRMHE